MPKVLMDANATMDFWQITTGGFSPLEASWERGDYERVLKEARLENGLVWPLSVILSVRREGFSAISEGDEVALADKTGNVLGIMRVEEKFKVDLAREAKAVYGYDDPKHPGVIKVLRSSELLLFGPIWALRRPDLPFADLCKTPDELRAEFKARG